ncbi:MAG: hypothetical protein RSD68_06285, partial [Oscillospiraceae bacterium]
GMTPPNDTTNYPEIRKKQDELAAVNVSLASARVTHKVGYADLTKYAEEWKAAESSTQIDAVYIKALADTLQNSIPPQTGTPPTPPSPDLEITLPYKKNGNDVKKKLSEVEKMVDAYTAISTLQNKADTLQTDINALYGSGVTGDWNYGAVKKELEDAKEKQVVVEGVLKKYQTALQTIKDKYTKWEAAETLVNTNQKALEDTMFALAEKRKADGKAQATESLDLADM